MSHLINVYSPDGEVFENSPVNARDLVVNAGWSYHNPSLTATIISDDVVIPEIAVPDETETPEEVPNGELKIEDGADSAIEESGSTEPETDTNGTEDETFDAEEEVIDGEVKTSRGRPRKNKE